MWLRRKNLSAVGTSAEFAATMTWTQIGSEKWIEIFLFYGNAYILLFPHFFICVYSC